MDEYNTGMDPEVKRYFRKIMATVGAGLLWIMLMVVLGLYFRMGYVYKGVDVYNTVFYVLLLATLVLLLWYLHRVWKR